MDDNSLKRRTYASIVSSGKVSHEALSICQSVGDELADIMLNCEAAEILAQAKRDTAAAVIAEKKKKDEAMQRLEAEALQI